MANSNLEEFLKAIQEDKAFSGKFEACFSGPGSDSPEGSLEKVVTFGKENGYEFTPKAFLDAYQELSNQDDIALSDASLEGVSGGGIIGDYFKSFGNEFDPNNRDFLKSLKHIRF